MKKTNAKRREEYIAAEVDLVLFDICDVITTSEEATNPEDWGDWGQA